MNRNFRFHRDVVYYAKQANLSTGYFSSIITRMLGHKPMEFIILITLQNAKNLLDTTQKSIKEIADDLGFPEQYTFRKYFKTHVGVSPRMYRKRSE